jgi:N-acetylmuramoyl-L-alanine amidase
MQIENHKLTSPDEKIAWVPSPNHGGKYPAGKPDTIVIHYTAGRSAAAAVKTLTKPGSGVSAHLVIGREGDVFQLVAFDTVAWHAGESEYRGRKGFNKYSIGIEIDNAGTLTRTGDGNFASWFGGTYPAADAIEAVHRNEKVAKFWHRYSDNQIELVEAICAALIAQYGITSIVGHEEIAVGRKQDPGPAFPLDKLRNRLLFEKRSSDEGLPQPAAPAVAAAVTRMRGGMVIAAKLNVRREAHLGAPPVAAPLPRGTMVTVEQHLNGWNRIVKPVPGWVRSEFVQLMT